MGEELQRLLQSGFVRDTLFPIAGKPSGVRGFSDQERQMLPPGVTGQFDPEDDEVQIRGGRPAPSMRRTLTHEMGHRFARRKVLPRARSRTLTPELQQLLMGIGQGRRKVESRDSTPRSLQHSMSNEDEYLATAFQRALDALRVPEGAERDSAIAEAEREVPGTRAMANFLMNLGPFQDEKE